MRSGVRLFSLLLSFLLCVGCGGPTAALERQLASGTTAERAAAARALGEMGPRAAPARAALVTALGDTEADVRRQAAHAVGRLGPSDDAAALDRLKGCLADDDRAVRLAAAYALVELAPSDAAPVSVLAEAARGGDPRACVALGRMGAAAEEAVPALIVAAGSPTALVRGKALEALERIGSNDPRAAVVLRRAKAESPGK